MKIYLIRHGKTTANEQWLYSGFSDVLLSKNGIEELKQKANSKVYPNASNLKVYTSGLIRTEQTLNILFGDIEHTALPAFKEMNFGDFENRSYQMMKNDPDYIKWCEGENLNNVCPNGESGMQMAKRVIDGLNHLINKDEDCLVICHGGPIAAIVLSLFPDDNKNWYSYQPGNGEGYEIEFINKKPVSIKKIPE